MHTGAHARRRWTALAAAFLFAFQALIASVAQADPGTVVGTTVILCTASGPRVVTFDANGDVGLNAPPHSSAGPDCCVAGCAMLGGAPPPGSPPPLVWWLPAAPRPLPAATVDIPLCNAPSRLPRRSRAPPRLA